MDELGREQVVWARRLGDERKGLHIGLSTPLEQFEYVLITTIRDEYDAAEGHIGPLRWYVVFHDRSGRPIDLAFFDNDAEAEAFSFAEGLGVPAGGWQRVDGIALTDDRVMPEQLIAQLG
jgi:hypothetical protein